MLLEHDNHFCCVLQQDNDTALHYAAIYGKNNTLTYLINHGAGVDDVNIVSYYIYISQYI